MTGIRPPPARPRRRVFAAPLLLAAALAGGACGGEPPPEAGAGEVPATAAAATADTLAGRYASPPDFEPAFTTVLPPDVRAEQAEVEAGPADVIRFFSHAGGVRHDSAFVQMFVWPQGQSADAAEEVVRTAAERVRIPGDRSELAPIQRHPWATVEYEIRSVGTAGEPVKGWVAMGRHGGRWFYVIAQAPERLAPTFLPTAEAILEQWRWRDTGRGLAQAPPTSVTKMP